MHKPLFDGLIDPTLPPPSKEELARRRKLFTEKLHEHQAKAAADASLYGLLEMHERPEESGQALVYEVAMLMEKVRDRLNGILEEYWQHEVAMLDEVDRGRDGDFLSDLYSDLLNLEFDCLRFCMPEGEGISLATAEEAVALVDGREALFADACIYDWNYIPSEEHADYMSTQFDDLSELRAYHAGQVKTQTNSQANA
jgi:hypothetical protein